MENLITQSLRAQAGDVLRGKIVSGELEAGVIYSAIVLAEGLGVSPTPVREAMLDLATSGLVEPVRNRGYRVCVLNEHDLEELSELRTMIEVPATRRAVERATDAELAALEPEVSAIERAAREGDVAGFILADRRFHLGLVALTRNDRLVGLTGRLRDQARLTGMKPMAMREQLIASAMEHRPILEAVQARDADRAEHLARAHLERTRIWLSSAHQERS